MRRFAWIGLAVIAALALLAPTGFGSASAFGEEVLVDLSADALELELVASTNALAINLAAFGEEAHVAETADAPGMVGCPDTWDGQLRGFNILKEVRLRWT